MVYKPPQKVFHSIQLHVTLPFCPNFSSFSHSILISLHFSISYSQSCCFIPVGSMVFSYLEVLLFPVTCLLLQGDYKEIILEYWRGTCHTEVLWDLPGMACRGWTPGVLRKEGDPFQHLGSQTAERGSYSLVTFFEQLTETLPELSTSIEIFNTFQSFLINYIFIYPVKLGFSFYNLKNV